MSDAVPTGLQKIGRDALAWLKKKYNRSTFNSSYPWIAVMRGMLGNTCLTNAQMRDIGEGHFNSWTSKGTAQVGDINIKSLIKQQAINPLLWPTIILSTVAASLVNLVDHTDSFVRSLISDGPSKKAFETNSFAMGNKYSSLPARAVKTALIALLVIPVTSLEFLTRRTTDAFVNRARSMFSRNKSKVDVELQEKTPILGRANTNSELSISPESDVTTSIDAQSSRPSTPSLASLDTDSDTVSLPDDDKGIARVIPKQWGAGEIPKIIITNYDADQALLLQAIRTPLPQDEFDDIVNSDKSLADNPDKSDLLSNDFKDIADPYDPKIRSNSFKIPGLKFQPTSVFQPYAADDVSEADSDIGLQHVKFDYYDDLIFEDDKDYDIGFDAASLASASTIKTTQDIADQAADDAVSLASAKTVSTSSPATPRPGRPINFAAPRLTAAALQAHQLRMQAKQESAFEDREIASLPSAVNPETDIGSLRSASIQSDSQAATESLASPDILAAPPPLPPMPVNPLNIYDLSDELDPLPEPAPADPQAFSELRLTPEAVGIEEGQSINPLFLLHQYPNLARLQKQELGFAQQDVISREKVSAEDDVMHVTINPLWLYNKTPGLQASLEKQYGHEVTINEQLPLPSFQAAPASPASTIALVPKPEDRREYAFMQNEQVKHKWHFTMHWPKLALQRLRFPNWHMPSLQSLHIQGLNMQLPSWQVDLSRIPRIKPITWNAPTLPKITLSDLPAINFQRPQVSWSSFRGHLPTFKSQALSIDLSKQLASSVRRGLSSLHPLYNSFKLARNDDGKIAYPELDEFKAALSKSKAGLKHAVNLAGKWVRQHPPLPSIKDKPTPTFFKHTNMHAPKITNKVPKLKAKFRAKTLHVCVPEHYQILDVGKHPTKMPETKGLEAARFVNIKLPKSNQLIHAFSDGIAYQIRCHDDGQHTVTFPVLAKNDKQVEARVLAAGILSLVSRGDQELTVTGCSNPVVAYALEKFAEFVQDRLKAEHADYELSFKAGVKQQAPSRELPALGEQAKQEAEALAANLQQHFGEQLQHVIAPCAFRNIGIIASKTEQHAAHMRPRMIRG